MKVSVMSSSFFGTISGSAVANVRIILFGSALLLIKPGLVTDHIGLGGLLLALFSQLLSKHRFS